MSKKRLYITFLLILLLAAGAVYLDIPQGSKINLKPIKINFDQPVMEANGIEFCGLHDDTMVMWGCYWSDLPRNLQACAQMAGWKFPWKHISDLDLSFYGACDVDATLCLYEYLKSMLTNAEV